MKNKLPFKNKILLAPMEEVNDIVFRLLCKKAGAGATYTGMIHPQSQQKIYFDDKPIVQLFCTTPKGIKDFISKNDKFVLGWDFNLGCPAKTARKHEFGSFMQHKLEEIEKILKEIRNSTKKFFSIKIRKSKYSFELLALAEKYCDAICIHPRTQARVWRRARFKFWLRDKKQI
jgi:tRNA-dihydrouridine synthase